MSAAAGTVTTEWPACLPKQAMFPPVSILTPTYNRRRFLPWLMECIRAQTYPRERLEWVVFDDGTDCVRDLLEPVAKEFNLVYIRSEEKLNIGEKRNRLHAAARGTILVNMDDDDYYAAERVACAVQTLLAKKVELVGSTRNILYYTDDESIWEVGPYNANHGTFGTMAYTKKYAITHPCDPTVVFAEEISFTNNYKTPLAQLNPEKVMVVICHSENTFSKSKLRDTPSPVMRKTGLKLRSFIRKKEMRDFYSHA
jgi:glycosyltransferase involved in cell wall biosynthesis